MSRIDTRIDTSGPDIAVTVTAVGAHHASRLVNLFAGGVMVLEQMDAGQRLRTNLRRTKEGKEVLALLAAHGGADFTEESDPATWPVDMVNDTLRRLRGRIKVLESALDDFLTTAEEHGADQCGPEDGGCAADIARARFCLLGQDVSPVTAGA